MRSRGLALPTLALAGCLSVPTPGNGDAAPPADAAGSGAADASAGEVELFFEPFDILDAWEVDRPAQLTVNDGVLAIDLADAMSDSVAIRSRAEWSTDGLRVEVTAVPGPASVTALIAVEYTATNRIVCHRTVSDLRCNELVGTNMNSLGSATIGAGGVVLEIERVDGAITVRVGDVVLGPIASIATAPTFKVVLGAETSFGDGGNSPLTFDDVRVVDLP